MAVLAAAAAGLLDCVMPGPAREPAGPASSGYTGPPGAHGSDPDPGQGGDPYADPASLSEPDSNTDPGSRLEADGRYDSSADPDPAAAADAPSGSAIPADAPSDPAAPADAPSGSATPANAPSDPAADPGSGLDAASNPGSRPEPPRRLPAGMTALEAGVAAAVNRLRSDPAWLVAALRRHRQNYRGDYLYLPGVAAPILTGEGVAAVDEAIAVARRARPRSRLRISPALSAAARAHAVEIGRAGTIDHVGRDGREPHQRMERRGRLEGLSGEDIGTGYGGADVMALSLYIDDGVRSRGHRTNLLEPDYRVLGVGCAPHRRYGTVCVLDLAAGFRE